MKSFDKWDLEESSKSECRKRFEKIMFGGTQGLEPDTEIEAKIWKQLRHWMSGSMKSDRNALQTQYQHMFRELAKCKDLYKNVLDPKAAGIKFVYHGSSMDSDYVEAIMGKAVPDKLKGVDVMRIDNWKYKSTGKVTSWSASRQIADFFADQRRMTAYMRDKSHTGVIYRAKLDDTFLMNPKFTNKVMREQEIIRFENTPIKTTLFIVDDGKRLPGRPIMTTTA